jgi:PAS domain S-box-containing protein
MVGTTTAEAAVSGERELATLLAREERVSLTLTAGRIHTWDWDVAADLLVWSESLVHELRIARAPGDSGAFRKLVHPDDLDLLAKRVEAALRGPHDYEAEFRMIRGDGSVHWGSARAIVVRDGAGNAVRMVGVHQDVTEQRELLRRALDGEARLRFAMEAAGAGAWEYAIDRDEFIASDGALQLHGLPPGKQISQREALDAVHPQDRPRVEQALRATIETGAPYRQELRAIQPDGSLRWLLCQAELRQDGGERRLIGLAQDITQRKTTEAALLQSQERFAVALGNSPTAVFEQDLDLRYTWIYNAKLGYAAEAVVGKTDADLMDAAYAPALEALKRRVVATGTPVRQEVAVAAPGEPAQCYDLHIGPRRDASGRLVGVICAATDVTARRSAEDKLRSSEELLRSVIEHLPDPMLLANDTGKILLVNPALTKMTGYTIDELPSRDAWMRLAYGTAAAEVGAAAAACFEKQEIVEVGERWVRAKSGEQRLWSLRIVPAGREADGARLQVCIGEEITLRRAAEAAARRSQEQLQVVADSAPVMLSHFDPQLRFLFVNKYALERLGKTSDEVIGRTLQEVASPATYAAIREAVEQALTGQHVEIEFTGPLRGQGQRTLHVSYVPQFDEDGRVCSLVNASTDITAGRKVEEALRDSETRYRSAMVIGRMASWETNYATGVRTWTPEGLQLFGLDLADGNGAVGGDHDEFLAALHPGDRHLYQAFHDLERRQDSFAAEYRIVRPDGQTRWMSGYGRVVDRSEDGRPLRMVNVATDVTERKALEDHAQFLLRELSHRSKNTLTVIQAIVAISSRNASSVKEFTKTITERLRALAASNDLLTDSSWKGAHLGQLVNRQIGAFIEIPNPRVSVSGPDVGLTGDAMQPIGLALHELTTNAMKYGALSNSEGVVRVDWRIEADPAAPVLRLDWTEHGGPEVAEPQRKGFGQVVIKHMIEQALSATTTIEYPATGVRWSMRAPAASVVRPLD